MHVRKPTWLFALSAVVLILTACGPSNESMIATSVAQTVEAQNALTPTAVPVSIPTSTLLAGITPIPTLTNIVPTIGPTATGGASQLDCTKASLVTEDPPDGTIFLPEQTFFKTWQIKNESNCTWNTSYKIVYWDGDLLGGAYYYYLPQPVAPGRSIDISLQLASPKLNGSYKGEWKLQTSDGINFGVGQYSEPFYVDIVVSTDNDPNYHITSVTYRIERDPAAGCATNVVYTVYATVTANGPLDVRVQWLHKDGYRSSKIRLTFTEAGSQELVDRWPFHLSDSTGEKWTQLIQVDPGTIEFDKAVWDWQCG